VSGLARGLACGRTAYSRSGGPRLWLRPALGCAGLASVAVAVAGCSVTTQLGSFFSKDKADAASPQPLAAPADAGDLSAVRAAASTMLSSGEPGTQWENPATGARGTITPLASNAQGGTQCRDFLASYVREQSESWLEGEACRDPSGRWDVRSLAPWKRS
jgi:surface antigen